MADVGYQPPYWWNQAWKGAALQGEFGKSNFPTQATTYAGRSAEISGELSEAQASQSYELAKQTETARENIANREMGLKEQEFGLQKTMAPIQSAISAVGAAGQAALGYGVLSKTGALDNIIGGGAEKELVGSEVYPGVAELPAKAASGFGTPETMYGGIETAGYTAPETAIGSEAVITGETSIVGETGMSGVAAMGAEDALITGSMEAGAAVGGKAGAGAAIETGAEVGAMAL
jgi:hypothetical protein